ncbi:hypothetical protein NVV93_11355 [Pseudomonas sp. LS44]|nr:hypothetical protein [Pseudomonas sp. LS44]UVE16219.1 hypothetical protein NVV93_11355 [Pseudomonas sp. LS44]
MLDTTAPLSRHRVLERVTGEAGMMEYLGARTAATHVPCLG